jgi:hypothetical protein
LIRRSQTIVLASLFSISFSAFAFGEQPATNRPTYAQNIATKPGAHLVLIAGFTSGGDTIETAQYTDGSSKNVKGGGLAQFGLGASYQFQNTPLALLLSANYHYHTATASNGDITFSRVPIEVLAYYTGVERCRFGAGVRLVNSPETKKTINGVTQKTTYDKTTGAVVEFGYKMAPSTWLNLRYVSEKYQGNTRTNSNGTTTPLTGSKPISGNHFGVMLGFEF